MIETPLEVLGPVNIEREHALEKYGFRPRPVSEHILLIEKYVRDAKQAWTRHSGDDRTLHELRKVAACVLQCLSEHGCPHRNDPFKNGDGQDDLPQKSLIIERSGPCQMSDDLPGSF